MLPVMICLSALSVPTTEPSLNAAEADGFAKRLAEVRQQAPAGFTVMAQPPFVVAGDEPAPIVHLRATRIVKWAVDMLKKDYFERDPARTIVIWLFKDKTSYDQHVWSLFQDRPDTPFGYYSSQHAALIMNIATGGGTLVHEIVHPFMAANFPACPAWFNEGLGSLYEQSEEKNGHIHGLPNWRLAALQQNIRAGGLPDFRQLTSMTDDAFYGRSEGASYNQHYAQSRYLCYYLQERGLLVSFYREFTAHAGHDPTGYQSLQKVLGTTDMKAFTEQWKAFVLKLQFP